MTYTLDEVLKELFTADSTCDCGSVMEETENPNILKCPACGIEWDLSEI